MRHSFYHYVLKHRGGGKNDSFSAFAEAMFKDHTFPKQCEEFEELSSYIEEEVHPHMPASTFDQLWVQYVENEKE